MKAIQAEYIKSQIKNGLSIKNILDFYLGEHNRIGRYKCPFNVTESHNNIGVKSEHSCRCFSCGESWDEIDFVKKLFNYKTYSEVLERIAIDFRLDTKDKLDKNTVEKINKFKLKKEKDRQIREERECFTRSIFNKVCERQYQLEETMNKYKPRNANKLTIYAKTRYPAYFMLAMKQYQKNEMLLNVLSESETDDRTDFIYGLAVSKEEKKKRKENLIDMLKSGIIKVNEKGDVLYG